MIHLVVRFELPSVYPELCNSRSLPVGPTRTEPWMLRAEPTSASRHDPLNGVDSPVRNSQ